MKNQKLQRRDFLKGMVKSAVSLQAFLLVPKVAQAQFIVNSAWRKKPIGRPMVSWGDNSSGALGINSVTNKSTPTAVCGITNAIAFSGGSGFSLALLSNGCVMSWGCNSFGNLGDNTSVTRCTPVPVIGVSTATAVASSIYTSAVLLSNGKVLTWGCNSYGNLGDASVTNRSTPVAVCSISTAVAIAVGYYHTLALLGNGSILTWGSNGFGQLGNNSTIGSMQTTPVMVCGITNAVAIAAGWGHSIAMLANGCVMVWGQGSHGELGNNTAVNACTPVMACGISTATAIASGSAHGMALLTNNTIVSWGQNTCGQLGIGSASLCRLTPGAVCGISTAVNISNGYYHSLAVLQNGVLMGWGDGTSGQLSSSCMLTVTSPIQVDSCTNWVNAASGFSHTLGVRR